MKSWNSKFNLLCKTWCFLITKRDQWPVWNKQKWLNKIIFFSFLRELYLLLSDCILYLKCLNCSSSLVPLPFMKLGPYIVIKLGHSLTCGNRTTMYIIKQDLWVKLPLMNLINFDFASVVSRYLWYPFFFVTLYISTFMVFFCIRCKWLTFCDS